MFATVEFPVFEPDVYVTHMVRSPPIDELKLCQNDTFQVVQSKMLNDGFCRALILIKGQMASIKVGEMIPGACFEKIDNRSDEDTPRLVLIV